MVTYIHHSLNLSDERWKLDALSSWRSLSIGLSFVYPTAVPSAQSEISWELVQKQLGNIYLTCRNVVILIWIQCSNVLHLPFSALGLTWRALQIFFETIPRVGEVCQLPANNVSRLVQFVRKLQRCRWRPDWVFLGAVNTPDKDLQCTEDRPTWCAGSKGSSGGIQQRRDQSANPPEWPESLQPHVNFSFCLLGLIAHLLSDATSSKSLCKKTPPVWCPRNWEGCCSRLSA